VLGFAAGVLAVLGTVLAGNGLMTGAAVGFTTGVNPVGRPGFVTGAEVAGAAGRGAVVAGGAVTGFDGGTPRAGVGAIVRPGAFVVPEEPVPVDPDPELPGFAAGTMPRLGGVGVAGSTGATSLGGAACEGADERGCTGWIGTVGRSWAGIGVG
jgi:hypothetical protein